MAVLGLAMLTILSLLHAPTLVRAQAYSISFTVIGLPAGVVTRYYVDGVLNGTVTGSDTKTLGLPLGGAHTLTVDLYVGGSSGTRYQCTGNVWSFVGTDSHSFTYKTQYFLEVVSPYGSPSGSDWYDEGATARAVLDTNMTAGPEGMRYVFVKWDQDASGQGTATDSIIMNGPKKAVADWKTQYNLRISYDPVGLFSPLILWFDADSTAEFTAPEGTNGTDVRQVFVQWVGDYSGTSARGSVRVDGPKSVTAKYKAQYKLSVTFDPPEIAQRLSVSNSTWYDAGQNVSLGPVPQVISIPDSSVKRFVWFSWNIDGMTQPGTSTEVLMNKPHSVRLIYQAQYYLLVTSTLGETTGSGWYVEGQTARFGVSYGGPELLVKHNLTGWRLNSSNVIRTLPPGEMEVTMDRPYVIEAQWSTDYTQLWIFIFALVSVGIVVTGAIVVIVKRPGSLGRLGSSLKSGLRRRKIGKPSTTPQASSIPCQKCGAPISSTAEYCRSCGAIQKRGQLVGTSDIEGVDNRVYDYIEKHHGEISLSQASKDLGLSADEVRLSTERLKNKGRLA